MRENLALNYALELRRNSGASITAVFVLSDDEHGEWRLGGACRWWLHHSLVQLAASLNELKIPLLLRVGPYAESLDDLIKSMSVSHLVWNRRYDPHTIPIDSTVKAAQKKQGVIVETFLSHLLWEPWEIKKGDDGPYQVFTPYWKACLKLGRDFSTDLSDPEIPKILPKHPTVRKKSEVDSLPALTNRNFFRELFDLDLLPALGWDSDFYSQWNPGENGAYATLDQFSKKAANYGAKRNFPSEPGTSKISPHFRFGEISPTTVWRKICEDHTPGSVEPYLRELGWREFSYHLLYYFPHTTTQPLKTKFNLLPWAEDENLFALWSKGNTGYPIVDAGMRELWTTGWMHNRVRMIVASFLVKDLFIPWQQGAKWFWDTLVDADLASNTQGWQWTAGCGADAAPYFRVFNPITQGMKFDTDGVYVRKWVPELQKLSNKYLHCPWEAPAAELKSAGVVLGETYNERAVLHDEARVHALQAYDKIK